MVIILSPAKNMNIKNFEGFSFEKPTFYEETKQINRCLNKLEPQDIETIMKVNKDIALKTFFNIKDFQIDKMQGHSLKCYDGLVFKNINVEDFDNDDITFANNHLRILSGLYGVLKPLTYIQPYRLEMGCKIEIDNIKNLYKFWGDKIYNEIIGLNKPVINLASKEYSKTITPYLKSNDKFINIDFLVLKNGKYKSVATSSKMARGQMARYIIKNKITNIEALKDFYYDIYQYNNNLSNENNLVFTN
ncbi:peroxide stress protein YaaA [uncultured Tyzzerella sp.]|uniref:peroxide stress protein YaaA n=1 Tax=uncultured Tyzzerella sp. TaxID=2321398 RepID=UPI002943C0D6|nr:peroxide stress protein YaaA [uncultured Tyzzerella sp.]